MSLLENDFTNITNQFIFSHYGNDFALGFKGAREFVERSHNLCHNYSITKGDKPLYLDENFGYVLTNRERLFKGLKSYFVNELKFNKVVPLLKDEWNEDETEYLIEYNEEAIEKLAEEQTHKFILEKIAEENFMIPANKSSSSIDPYQVSYLKQDVSLGSGFWADMKE